ncbi:MAG TPA: glycoside hydrolase family 3 N-terminal domain-containing protein [Longimicrobiales bacterium]|nr:glycoside hydrolase family 3 N-terminal domain-containing protein [Longimicrobiales bacterium]
MTSAPHLQTGVETEDDVETLVSGLLARMTLAEKIGQLNQVNGRGGHVPEDLAQEVREGRVGSVLNEVDVRAVNELQRIAVEESRLGIPLLLGRDVIHGFKTVLPIPLAQACSWDPELVRQGARMAALEAAAQGVHWTFAPMVDIGRDPRWGRVAECLGEDPYLSGVLAAAMVRGFQGDDLARSGSIAACAKHFAGYGASESGKDYNSTNIPERELRSVHLPPFKAALDAGVATFMASFSDLDGIPATGNRFLMTEVLREEWGFDGFVVSDWESIAQLTVHGLTGNASEASLAAAEAGVDMDMAGWTYAGHLAELVETGRLPEERVDAMAGNVLRVKARLGLFQRPYTDPGEFPAAGNPYHLALAREAAVRSAVLLRNEGGALPLDLQRMGRLAVIGPLADEPQEQLGTWVFDGDPELSCTPLEAIRALAADRVQVRYARGMETTRSRSREGFREAVDAAEWADAVVLFLGEEAVLSGEAHCRADVSLPGIQEELVREVREAGKPVVLVLMAGRPLALERIVDQVDALLCAWHPGTMAGPALADLLFGNEAPSGKLPITFPRVTGQIPIYYGHRNTGKPATPESFVHLDDLPPGAPQLSTGNTSFHLDTHYTPLFPFGHGLSYTRFEYHDLRVDGHTVPLGGTVSVAVDVVNTGARTGTEVVQLYTRDPVASVTRPVRELKGFRRVTLEPGERRTVTFELHTDELAFPGRDMRPVTEPGRIQVWVGGDSNAMLGSEFHIESA